MIVVTGAYGFIGSCLISYLNNQGITDIIAVDDFSKKEKSKNLEGKLIKERIERKDFLKWFHLHGSNVSFVFHIGARTDTTEFNYDILEKLNVTYSQKIWQLCTTFEIPMVYASSAATYGNGEIGYQDNILPKLLHPLNPYGISKNEFDRWVLRRRKKPPFWAGMKFFNVYGPNEYHKGRMASTIWHFFNQIKEKDSVSLFQSHHQDYKNGEQQRDFVYVKDVIKVLYFLYKNYKKINSGIYNLGTGKARTFNDLVKNVFKNLNKNANINYIPTPEDIRDKYQYFTEADIQKLRQANYNESFMSLEDGIKDYVQNYLIPNKYY